MSARGTTQDRLSKFVSASEKVDEMAKQFNIKVHFIVNRLPEDVVFALLEADSPLTLAPFLASIPLKQDFKVTPRRARAGGRRISQLQDGSALRGAARGLGRI
ncbi:MAG: hypothetical protein V3U79_06975 [Dehalococcoidia bacterium]